MRQKTIEETYQKKTPLEHILIRPDTYVGSIEMEKSSKWVMAGDQLKLDYREISYVPALYKIFDQVLVNAADNYQRDHRGMNLLKVDINAARGSISVLNNGKGIPVQMHKSEKVYVPELIFGHLLTGSNYNDNQKKVVGGRNGYGAKLANIFSTKFIVECGDCKNKKKFVMEWSKNMTMHTEPDISQYSGKDYTIITFFPQFHRFGMSRFDDDILALFKKRVFDMAGLLPTVKVHLNDKQININSFLKYVNLYFPDNKEFPKVRDGEVDSERWQVVISTSDGQFRQVSFVNSICTSKGGTHVNYLVDQIVEKVQQKLKKKDKNLNVKPFQIKAHLWVFVNCLIENPAFDSQTKQTLTLKQSLFGSECILSEKMIKEILKTGIVDDIFQEAKLKQMSKLAKLTGGGKKSKLTGIPKLEDANDAGTRNSQKCTLILTEGDSAKSLAMAGLQVIGRDLYGVFPLKGKLLNARQATSKTLLANQQIQNVIKIIGLQISKPYSDLKSLRYGSIMIMSDQDTDGSHIKGLVINFIHHFWPSLFQMNGFLKQFITPLLKVSKGSEVISFYTMRDYKVWCEGIPNLKNWKTKYYKGLGTSTDKEAMDYFQNLARNKIEFAYNGNEDDEAIELIFSKKKIEQRKEWLSHYDPSIVMVYDRPKIFYKEFVDKEFIHFSNEDNNRSIASAIDGFKPGQRKIMFACFKRNLKQQIKVAQLAGYVAQHSAYHHGQMSLTMTIVNMAQNFVGSNNINLLMPNGQFGSRNLGGKDHASARYIFTNLSKVTRTIFPEPDDHSLTYIEDDGQLVQPQFYMPIIPMILVNGCEGIGSGWSTSIPNFNPRQLAEIIMRRLQQDLQFKNLKPWYKNFGGQINQKQDLNFEVKGRIQFDDQNQKIMRITELPINKWTKDYKIFLDQMMTQGDSKVVGLKEYHTKNKVHFELQMNEQFLDKHRNDLPFMQKTFKTQASISMKNMVGFTRLKTLKRFATIKQIFEDFFQIRLQYYEKRKTYLISRLDRQVAILSNKARFIIEVVEETLVIRNIKKIKLVEQLKEKKYVKFTDLPMVKSTKIIKGSDGGTEEAKPDEARQEDNNAGQDQSKQYNYLLSLPLWSLTFEKVEEIKKQMQDKKNELKVLQSTSLKQMWKFDLVEFLKTLDKVEIEEEEDNKIDQYAKAGQKGQKAKKKNVKAKVKEEAKDKVKKERINWDQSDDGHQTKPEPPKAKKQAKIEAKKQAGLSKSKISKEVSQSKKQPQMSDFMQRVQRKVLEKKDAELHGNTAIARPIGSKKTINSIFQTDGDYEIVNVSRPREPKKKKMDLDSDQSEGREQQLQQQWKE